MEEMRIYITNLGKYNEGELVGAWFTPPVDFEEVKERIGLNDEYEEYAIHDYELPLRLTNTPLLRKSTVCVRWWRTYRSTFRKNYQRCNPILAVSKNSVSMRTILSAISAVMIWQMWLATIWKKADSLGNFRHTYKTISTMKPMGVTWNWREPLLSQTTAYMKSYGKPVCISFGKCRRLFYSGAAFAAPSFRKDRQHEENTKLYQYLVGGKDTLFHQ